MTALRYLHVNAGDASRAYIHTMNYDDRTMEVIRFLARALFWTTCVAGRLGWSVEELAKLAVEDKP